MLPDPSKRAWLQAAGTSADPVSSAVSDGHAYLFPIFPCLHWHFGKFIILTQETSQEPELMRMINQTHDIGYHDTAWRRYKQADKLSE